jgi:hypothetical protein
LDIEWSSFYESLIGINQLVLFYLPDIIKLMDFEESIEYRKVQGIVGEQSFSVVLPKRYAVDLGIGKGDFVRVHQKEGRIIIEKVVENW